MSTETDAIPLFPAEREAWYDANVAPKLMELGEACVARSIPLLALVGYDGLPGGSVGRTRCFPAQRSFYFCVMDLAAQCWEDGDGFNLDKLCIELARQARGTPHNSMVLQTL